MIIKEGDKVLVEMYVRTVYSDTVDVIPVCGRNGDFSYALSSVGSGKVGVFARHIKEVVSPPKPVPQTGDTVSRTIEYLQKENGYYNPLHARATGTVLAKSKDWLVVLFKDKPIVADISTFEVV